jgi:hypothetical protein
MQRKILEIGDCIVVMSLYSVRCCGKIQFIVFILFAHNLKIPFCKDIAVNNLQYVIKKCAREENVIFNASKIPKKIIKWKFRKISLL